MFTGNERELMEVDKRSYWGTAGCDRIEGGNGEERMWQDLRKKGG